MNALFYTHCISSLPTAILSGAVSQVLGASALVTFRHCATFNNFWFMAGYVQDPRAPSEARELGVRAVIRPLLACPGRVSMAAFNGWSDTVTGTTTPGTG